MKLYTIALVLCLLSWLHRLTLKPFIFSSCSTYIRYLWAPQEQNLNHICILSWMKIVIWVKYTAENTLAFHLAPDISVLLSMVVIVTEVVLLQYLVSWSNRKNLYSFRCWADSRKPDSCLSLLSASCPPLSSCYLPISYFPLLSLRICCIKYLKTSGSEILVEWTLWCL